MKRKQNETKYRMEVASSMYAEEGKSGRIKKQRKDERRDRGERDNKQH